MIYKITPAEGLDDIQEPVEPPLADLAHSCDDEVEEGQPCNGTAAGVTGENMEFLPK